MSLTVRDTARFLDVASHPVGPDRMALAHGGTRYETLAETLEVRGLRAAWSDDLGFIPTDPEPIAVARAAAETLVRAAELDWVDERFAIPNPREAWVAGFIVPIRGELERQGFWPNQSGRMTARARARIAAIDNWTLVDLARAAELRNEIDARAAAFFERVDVLLTPVTAVVSLPAEGPIPETIGGRDARLTGPEAHLTLANLTWQPAISVPAGFSRSGLPIGLQIVVPRWRDDIALRLARILEQAAPWPHLAPQYRSS